MRLHFITVGEPDDRFLSQVCMMRAALDSHGGIYQDARLTFLAVSENPCVPERWKPFISRIELMWSRPYIFPYAKAIADDVDITIICDADTLLIRPLPPELLEDVRDNPCFCGVIAHYTPKRVSDEPRHDYSNQAEPLFWGQLANAIIGRPIPMPYYYMLSDRAEPCPFYINYGFILGTPAMIKRYYLFESLIVPKVWDYLSNAFCGQISVPLVIDQFSIPHRALPFRYNFPTYSKADMRYPYEMSAAHVIHYLDRSLYDRHKIFTNREDFDRFLDLELEGSSLMLQNFIRTINPNGYPF